MPDHLTDLAMFEILRHPLPHKLHHPWRIVLIVSLTIFFVLSIFQPFGLNTVQSGKWFMILGYTLVTAVIDALVVYLFPLIFRKFYTVNWTVGKSIFNQILTILLIAIGNAIFSWIISGASFEAFIEFLLFFLMVTFLVAIVPLALINFFMQNHFLKANLKEATTLNQQLSIRQETVKTTEYKEKITLTGTTKDKITLFPTRILYVEASGNYVNVYYLAEDTKVKQSLLRATISHIETQLKDYKDILRCHRAFLINSFYIIGIEGNSQGFSLKLDHTNQTVPVSRTYTKNIRKKLK